MAAQHLLLLGLGCHVAFFRKLGSTGERGDCRASSGEVAADVTQVVFHAMAGVVLVEVLAEVRAPPGCRVDSLADGFDVGLVPLPVNSAHSES